MSEHNSRRAMQAFGMALLIEAAIVVTAATILIGATAVKKLSDPVPITLASAEPHKQAEPQPPKPQPPQPPQPKTRPQVKTVQPQVPRQQEALPIAPEPAPVAAATVFSEPAPKTPSPPAPPVATVGKVDPNLEYMVKVRAAVHAAYSYPPAAAAMHFSGRVRVEFHLRDAVPSQARVLVSSGVGFIDRAALQEVEVAGYPEPPAELRGHDNVYQTWVDFGQFVH
jgi:protein TonB